MGFFSDFVRNSERRNKRDLEERKENLRGNTLTTALFFMKACYEAMGYNEIAEQIESEFNYYWSEREMLDFLKNWMISLRQDFGNYDHYIDTSDNPNYAKQEPDIPEIEKEEHIQETYELTKQYIREYEKEQRKDRDSFR